MRIEVDALGSRRSGRRVFQGVSFGLEAGEAVVVTGRNGAGKSTLLAIVAGALRADEGDIRLSGAGERTLPECLHLVGHRDGLKSALTARENLAFAQALLGDAALSPEDALHAVGLAHAAALPVAYLSAGQRRRVALARLLVAHRPLWLLDEPTAALDASANERLLALLRAHLADGGLVLAATHQPLDLPGAKELRLERADAPSDRAEAGARVRSSTGRAVSPQDAGFARHRAPADPPSPEGRAEARSDRGGDGSEAGTAPPATRSAVSEAHRANGSPARLSRSAGAVPTRSLRDSASPPGRREGPATGEARQETSAAEGGMWRAFLALVTRDLKLAARIGGSGMLGLVFFLMIVTLVPFALGPDLNLLARIGPAVLWLAAVLATLIGLDRLFQADEEDGSLDLLRAAPAPLEFLVLAKVAAHWVTTGLPLAAATPLFGLLVALSPQAMGGTAASLLVGTPALTFVGAIGAALTASIRRGGLILAVLVLPLMIPTLIFAVSAANAATGGTVPFATPLLVLGALSLIAAVAGTFAAAAALRRGA